MLLFQGIHHFRRSAKAGKVLFGRGILGVLSSFEFGPYFVLDKLTLSYKSFGGHEIPQVGASFEAFHHGLERIQLKNFFDFLVKNFFSLLG